MNFFKLYIGDYQRDTGHLSVAEHGAYFLMMQHHYATEKPLPAGAALYRLLRANTKAERDAVDAVCENFWTQTPEGLVNNRAQEEIEKSEHQRTVNRETGKQGGRPKKTESKPNRNRIGFDSLTEQKPNDNPIQTPDSRLQDSSLRSESKISTPNGVVLQASPTTPPKRSWIEQAKDVLDFLNWKLSKAWVAMNPSGKPTANAGIVIARLKDGYTVDECKTVASLKIEQWFDDDKMRQFIRPSTLYRASRFADYLGETKRLPEEELRRIRIANGFQPASFQANGNGGSGHAH